MGTLEKTLIKVIFSPRTIILFGFFSNVSIPYVDQTWSRDTQKYMWCRSWKVF